MPRQYLSFPISDSQRAKTLMLNWANQFSICSYLDNHLYHLPHHSVECLLAAGAKQRLSASAGTAFSELEKFYTQNDDWLFGHFAYDLKNEVEELSSSNPDNILFDDLFFFVPEYVLQLNASELVIGSFNNDHDDVFKSLLDPVYANDESLRNADFSVAERFTKQEYMETISALKQHILRGDCYEINFCQEFYIENIDIDPLKLYKTLSRSSPNPFSAYYKIDDKYLSCLSPERYLKKEDKHILSQPIKGTSERRPDDQAADLISKNNLAGSEKEKAENIMIVDLVRNDLSRICEKGSVVVDELCEIYSFPQVHQMISTVSGELRDDLQWTEAIKATFPMGSMTGAPKKKVMELIEKYERTRRGLFSGSIGYIDPRGNFDFNVVIRSVLYNETNRYLSFPTGSAITFQSDAEMEYQECILKAAAIKKALAETNTFH